MPDYGTRKNCEGYSDPTAHNAIRNVIAAEEAEQRRLTELIRVLKYIVNLSGYDLIGRIHLRDKRTGREYR